MGFATLSKLWAIFQNKYFVFFLKFLIHFSVLCNSYSWEQHIGVCPCSSVWGVGRAVWDR